ncbi:MAG: N-acetyltransferase [Rhodothermaceae bacterium]|nr:N-acetyltransferase [Rhodothermaceae bacterium]
MSKIDLNSLNIINNEKAKQYEADLGSAKAKIEYIPTKKMIVFTHTEVPREYEGQGVANKMIRHVLDEARENNMQVHPMCPFVKLFIRRHPEYLDIVPERLRP